MLVPCKTSPSRTVILSPTISAPASMMTSFEISPAVPEWPMLWLFLKMSCLSFCFLQLDLQFFCCFFVHGHKQFGTVESTLIVS